MSKFNKFRDSIAGSIIILAVICAVVSGALALTYELTKDSISENKQREANATLFLALPDAEDFKAVEGIEFSPEVQSAMVATNGVGYAFNVKVGGFKDEFIASVGIDNQGQIVSVQPPTLHSETDGIGTNAFDPAYLAQYSGVTDTSGVDAVAGATITSGAVQKAATIALNSYLLIANPDAAAAQAEAGSISLEGYTVIEGLTLPAGVSGAYEANDKSGYGFEVTVDGFGGDINLIAHTDAAGNLIKMAAPNGSSETDGLGTKALDQAHLSLFYGKNNADGVDAIAGSTVTSDAVSQAVTAVHQAYVVTQGGELPAVDPLDALPTIDVTVGYTAVQAELPEGVNALYAGNDGSMVGDVSVKGYDGLINFLIKANADGLIEQIDVVSHTETKNLGGKALSAEYLGKYYGQATADGVDAVANATVTSKAVTKAVTLALETFAANKIGVSAGNESFFPAAESFEEVATLPEIDGLVSATKALPDMGYIFEVSVKGYGGPITLTVAIGSDGNILSVVAGSHLETKNLGSKALEPDYLGQFVGGNTTDGVDGVASATVSSDAVKKAIGIALEAYSTIN